MTRFVALLRAVNVGGSGKLPMQQLIGMCTDAGFENVRTYIASGNVVFSTDDPAGAVKDALKARLERYAGKPVGVFVRTAEALHSVLDGNPFADREPNRTTIIFLDEPPTDATLTDVSGANGGEEIRLGARELYVHYPRGIGRSKLRIPAAAAGTARNVNTVAKLLALAVDPD